jgi:uncharacterized protein YqjF (DUF2071 family)
VDRPVLIQDWRDLAFVHWRYEPAAVQAILPDGLEVDTFEGEAWVALVPFRMVRIRPPWGPSLGPLTTFPETNIRTYVRGPDGGHGVWFCSLEITRLVGVAVARTLFRVPYTWAAMDMEVTEHDVRYRSRRRWPAPRTARSDVVVRPGAPAEPTPLLDFLVNRWRAYTTDRQGEVSFSPVAHEPWVLSNATCSVLDETLTSAAGLPPPSHAPLVHFSTGVSARIGRPRTAESRHR